jgi:hypothetical protein
MRKKRTFISEFYFPLENWLKNLICHQLWQTKSCKRCYLYYKPDKKKKKNTTKFSVDNIGERGTTTLYCVTNFITKQTLVYNHPLGTTITKQLIKYQNKVSLMNWFLWKSNFKKKFLIQSQR